MKTLTLTDLKNMQPDEIFASGMDLIEHPWFNNATKCTCNEKGEKDPNGKYVWVRWAAVRGFIHDWAIYHSLDANFVGDDYLDSDEHLKIPYPLIIRHGAKLHDEEKIKELVPCDNEAFNMYRH